MKIEKGMPVTASVDLLSASLSRRKLLAATSTTASLMAVSPWMALRTAGAQTSGDEFVVANEAEPTDLLPWFGGYGAGLITRQIYETLAEPRMTLAADGSVEITLVPVLAESWERVDDTRWRFKLRQGVKFHNGEPFNAAAMKASFDVMGNGDLAAQFGKYNALAAVASAEVVDDFTIDFVAAVPTTELINISLRLGIVALPPAALEAMGIEAFAEQPIGTGPYQFESWTKGEEVRLTRFAEYWDPNGPAMPSVRYIARPEAAVRAQTVQAGEADFAYNIGAEQASALAHSVTGGGFQSSSIRLNNAIAPTNDIRVRQAINYAIDRDAIVETIFGGQAVAASFFGFQPINLDPYVYDPERAKALIDEAGAAGAELELVYGEGRIPEEDQLAEIYQAELQEIGLVVKLTKVEPRQYNEIGGKPFAEQPPLFMETTSSGNFGEIAGGLQDKYGCEGSGTYCNPEMDADFARLATLDGEERTAKLQEIAEALHAEAPRAWVAIVQQVHGLSERVVPALPLNAYIRFQDLSVR